MRDKRTEVAYDAVPPVACQGLCADTACATDVGDGLDADNERCINLVQGRCAIYEHRPLVCRLWGAVPEMPCPHGCTPTLSSVEGITLMVKSLLRKGTR